MIESNEFDEITVCERPQTEQDRAEAAFCFALLLSDYRSNAGITDYPQCSTGMRLIMEAGRRRPGPEAGLEPEQYSGGYEFGAV